MQGRKRIAIYGGTFDPVHLGHLAVARRTVELFEIDKLLFVPARQAPHKLEQEVTHPLHRYTMLALATQNDRQILVSSFELAAPDRRYTIDTLAHFQAEFGKQADLFFVMGADSWTEITTWRHWERLLTTANHIVVTRPGYEMQLDHVASLANPIVDVRGWDPPRVSHVLKESSGPSVYLTDTAMMDISATAIRDAVRTGQGNELKNLVPEPVAEYINKYELYKEFE